MTEDQMQRLKWVAAHLDSLESLCIKLAQGHEGNKGDDLMLAGTFYSISNSIEREKTAMNAVIHEQEMGPKGGAS